MYQNSNSLFIDLHICFSPPKKTDGTKNLGVITVRIVEQVSAVILKLFKKMSAIILRLMADSSHHISIPDSLSLMCCKREYRQGHVDVT